MSTERTSSTPDTPIVVKSVWNHQYDRFLPQKHQQTSTFMQYCVIVNLRRRHSLLSPPPPLLHHHNLCEHPRTRSR